MSETLDLRGPSGSCGGTSSLWESRWPWASSPGGAYAVLKPSMVTSTALVLLPRPGKPHRAQPR